MRVFITIAIALSAADAGAECTVARRCVTSFFDPEGAITPRLAVSGDDVFFSDSGNVFAVSKTTSVARCITSSGCIFPRLAWSHSNTPFAVGGAYLYYSAVGQRLARMALATGVRDFDVTTTDGVIAASPRAVAYSSQTAAGFEVRFTATDGRVATPVALVNDLITHIWFDGRNIYWIATTTLYRVSLTPVVGTPVAIGSFAHPVTDLISSGGTVFVATTHEILRLPLNTITWSTLAPTGADHLATDGIDVYWTNLTHGYVAKISVTGGAATFLTVGAHPTAIAVDESSVFYIDGSRREIMRITPK